MEIIKNCYDADSNKVKVTFDIGVGEGKLKISDDGTGMGRGEIINGFLKIASGLKVEYPVSAIYKRKKAGRKGIGRFSTQRLGRKLILRTRREKDSIGWELLVNWDDFESGKTLQDIKVILKQYEKATVGTEVIILGLRDTWSDAQIKRAWRGVLSLQQPFPIAPVENKPSIDPGFSVDFYKGGGLYKDEMVIADLKTEILDHLHAVVDMMVDKEGSVFWRISKNKLGESFDWRKYEYTSKDIEGSNKEIGLTNVWMKAYHVVLEPSLLPSFVYTRVRDELSKRGGGGSVPKWFQGCALWGFR
ncbi:ATP-binding protein [Halomonas sp. HNIBRBA4712]|uniref:ATP-binding protein n=1 Tax=Halomonas sp. HNIBRBA4712 TaxID=3373087 RepID=UPI0037454872